MIFYEPQRDIAQGVSSKTFLNLYAMLHFHRSIELIYVNSGILTVKTGAKTITAHQDEIAFIPAYFAHEVTCNEKGQATNFIIPHKYYKIFVDREIPLYYSLLDDKDINKKILQIINQAQPVLPNACEILARGYAEVVLGLISNNYQPEQVQKNDNDFIMKVIQYIDLNYQKNITLSAISEHFHYSTYHFSKLFNRSFGCNLSHYINQVRYNRVLSEYEKGKNITELIIESGFNDVSTFYKYKSRAAKLQTELLKQ